MPETVMVAIPALDWMFYEFVFRLINLDTPAGSVLQFAPGPRSIAWKRNYLTEAFLESAHDWLFFLDTDQTFAPDVLSRLLRHRVPVVGALIFQRMPPYNTCAWVSPTERLEDFTGGLTEVAMVGTGAMLIQRPVLERLGGPWFADHAPTPGVGSDTMFCCRVREELGVPVYCDTDTRAGHLATVPVDLGYREAWRASWQPLQTLASQSQDGRRTA